MVPRMKKLRDSTIQEASSDFEFCELQSYALLFGYLREKKLSFSARRGSKLTLQRIAQMSGNRARKPQT